MREEGARRRRRAGGAPAGGGGLPPPPPALGDGAATGEEAAEPLVPPLLTYAWGGSGHQEGAHDARSEKRRSSPEKATASGVACGAAPGPRSAAVDKKKAVKEKVCWRSAPPKSAGKVRATEKCSGTAEAEGVEGEKGTGVLATEGGAATKGAHTGHCNSSRESSSLDSSTASEAEAQWSKLATFAMPAAGGAEKGATAGAAAGAGAAWALNKRVHK